MRRPPRPLTNQQSRLLVLLLDREQAGDDLSSGVVSKVFYGARGDEKSNRANVLNAYKRFEDLGLLIRGPNGQWEKGELSPEARAQAKVIKGLLSYPAYPYIPPEKS